MKSLLEFLKEDKGWQGIVLGLVGPLIGFYLYYLMMFSGAMSFKSFLEFTSNPNILSKVISLGVLVNLPVFFLYIQFRHDRNARSVLFATFAYAGVIVYLNFFA